MKMSTLKLILKMLKTFISNVSVIVKYFKGENHFEFTF